MVCRRTPSSPGVPEGLALDHGGCHFGWIRNRCRGLIELFIPKDTQGGQGSQETGQGGQGSQETIIRVRIKALGKRWI